MYVFLLLSIFLLSCSSSKHRAEIPSQESERHQWMKDFAFCKCLEYSLGEEIAKEINEVDASKGVLFDIANLGGSVSQLDSITQAFIARQPTGQTADHGGKKPHIFNCLQFQYSQELDAFVNSLQ